jgi:hypothetical protein
MRELATRHGLDADALTEAWSERAAIREYLAGFGRRAAEVFAIGDVERMHQIGLHCPETRQRWAVGGKRVRPSTLRAKREREARLGRDTTSPLVELNINLVPVLGQTNVISRS